MIELGIFDSKSFKEIIESSLIIEKDSQGRTALTVAVECENTEVAKYLIENEYGISIKRKRWNDANTYSSSNGVR